MDKVETTILLTRRLIEIEAKETSIRAEKDKLRAEIAKLLETPGANGSGVGSVPGSLPNRVRHHLSANSGRTYTAKQLAQALDAASQIVSIRGTLARLANDKDSHVKNVGWGKYKFTEAR